MKPPTPATQRPELFYIHDDCINSSSREEVIASVEALQEINLYHLPYQNIDIEVSAVLFTKSIGLLGSKNEKKFDASDLLSKLQNNPDGTARFCFRDGTFEMLLMSLNGTTYVRFEVILMGLLSDNESFNRLKVELKSVDPTVEEEFDKFKTAVSIMASFYKDLFITLLSTKNVVKVRHENKAMRLGIGLRNEFRPLYTTTLSVPKSEHMSNDPDNPPRQGKSPRAHLRRGHVRHQHYGPKNSFIKQIWIPPIFVNADDSFISTREAYNVSKVA